MTDEERARILELLAREGQEQAPGILPESDGPPPFPPEEAEDLTEELWELLRQARKEAAALRRDIQELEEALEQERSRRAGEDTRREGRRARIYGFLAGVGISMCLLPLLAGTASLGWRLFRWLAGILGGTPELLAGGIALVLSGAVLLRAVKPLGRRLMNWMEEDDWEED